jgi:phosphate transport system substrate-binding protein
MSYKQGVTIMKIVIIIATALALLSTPSFARDNIQVAGSSTVLPYATIVAESFGENFDLDTPVVESGGSSSGLKRFCEGIGENTIDIANASRQIKEKEIAECKKNGVKDIIEVRIGYDGIVFANEINGFKFAFEPKDIYLAINKKSTLQTWDQVNKDFPKQDILMLIPGTKHGTREVFEEKVLLQGCKDSGEFEKIVKEIGDEKEAESQCMEVRTDNKSVDIDGDYTETLARIESNKNAIGVFGLSFYQNNTSKLRVSTMNGIIPSQETIARGEYPVSRPLFFYIKKAHIGIIPGLKEYAQFFVSDDIAGIGGPLANYGLVSDPELLNTQENLENEVTIK